MDIPVIPIRIRNGNILASHLTFSGTFAAMSENTVGFKDLMSSLSNVCSKDIPMLAVDVDGMRKRDIIPELLRKMKAKRELWYMTGIRNPGDVMDAFQGDIDKLVIPYHFTSDALLRDIAAISDSCIPALFIERGEVYVRGKKRGLMNCVRTLMNMNFRKILVFDVSGDNAWNDLKDIADTIIPYASSIEDADALRSIGSKDVLVSAVKLFQSASRRSEVGSCMTP